MQRAGAGPAGRQPGQGAQQMQQQQQQQPPMATALPPAPPRPAIEFPPPDDEDEDEDGDGEGPLQPHYDESDLPPELRLANGSQRVVNFTSSVANQLLLVSLLEHLCHVHAQQDPARSKRLFQVLCKTFTRMHLLSSFAFCDEFSSLRLQHNRAITELMKAANQQILSENLDNSSFCTNRENEVLFEAQTSRYINEFDEISRLGKGGYGTVYKVRNKLDGQFYAIKKILIKKATKSDCMKVLREVKVLARLQHPNIVGYHTAWMEHVQPAHRKGGEEEPPLRLPSLKMCSAQENTEDKCRVQGPDDSSFILFANSMPEESVCRRGEGNGASRASDSPRSSSSCVSARSTPVENLLGYNQDRQKMKTSDSSSDEDGAPDLSLNRQCEMEYHLMLHIQMQLCDISLWDWIAGRNKSCLRAEEVTSPYHLVDVQCTLKIFQELLEGVYYIHSMGVMHRDIKPRNIFLHGSDHHVKIGDFGLACREILQENTSRVLDPQKRNDLLHTSGVGTCLYAAPEQLQGSRYDFKSDMYSVGIILLELFQPFGTEMERTEVLMGLRNAHFPLTFTAKWPVQAKYTKLLTCKASSQRPTAGQLLESELFHNTANVICNLQQKVMQQEEEIRLLKEKLKLLQERESNQIKQLGSPV